MTNKSSVILSAIKRVWHFFVGLSHIISCIVSITSCYIAYTIVTERISLNIEISPIVEKFQKGSIVFIAPITTRDSLLGNNSTVQLQTKHIVELRTEDSTYLRQEDIDNIRKRRDAFLRKCTCFLANKDTGYEISNHIILGNIIL